MNLLIDLHFAPSLEYISILQQFDEIVLEKNEHYVKQSFRNRCYIKTANGVEMLVVPLTAKHGKVPMHEVRIDYSMRWQNNHWRTIESAYRKAPYYEYYSDELKKILYHGYPQLFELNRNLLSFCLKNIGHKPNITETLTYEKQATADTLDLRSAISAKIPYSERTWYRPVAYYQVFGNTFVPNLSVLDLLFCQGPRAGSILTASRIKD